MPRLCIAIRKSVSGLALSALLSLAAAPCRADIVPFNQMLNGITITPAQCAALPQAVWVTAYGHGYCIRYYLSNAGGEGTRPAVFLEGDQLGQYNEKTDQFTNYKPKDIDTDKLALYVDSISRRVKTTAIYLARIGVDGSSGRESARHSQLELAVTNGALDAIKRRHNFAGFHLIGQSGGAGLVGGLLGRRRDIGCAVPGSGRLAILSNKATAGSPDRARFDPIQDTSNIVRNGARIVVITDPADTRVPEKHQTTFVNAVRAAGGSIEQHFVQATDDNHHGVTAYSIYAAGQCIAVATPRQIAEGLSNLVAKRIAAAREKRQATPSTQAQSGWGVPSSAGVPGAQPIASAAPQRTFQVANFRGGQPSSAPIVRTPNGYSQQAYAQPAPTMRAAPPVIPYPAQWRR
jgi:hypothetical protein